MTNPKTCLCPRVRDNTCFSCKRDVSSQLILENYTYCGCCHFWLRDAAMNIRDHACLRLVEVLMLDDEDDIKRAAVAKELGCEPEEVCFGCDQQKRKYVTGLCQKCHEITMCNTPAQCYGGTTSKDLCKTPSHIVGCPASAKIN